MLNPLSFYYSLRGYVDSYAGVLGVYGRRFLPLIWIVALGVVIWFYGYMLAIGSFMPLEPATNRAIAIALLVLGWVCWFVWSEIKRRRAEKAIIDDLAADSSSSPDADARAEVETLRTRLKEAMALLRRVGKHRFGYIYELPWYLIIGAPGSGKTTSIAQSGLKFPLGDALGAEPVKGVGGTRNCYWWFAEEAILIDTAGRYTTHGDFAGADKAGWNGFLTLLRKHRPSQPVNGALITLSISDLLQHTPETRLEEIRQIRQRLAEMDETLRARIPIYIVLTKADLLEGFVPFFDGLSRTERDQVWGMTFPLDVSQAPTGLPERFLEEFDLLRGRIDGLLLERLQQEPDIEVRGRIFQLPAQMSLLREPIREILAELCSQSKLVSPPLLRGVYFTSGTQVHEARTAGSLHRSYFLSRLFSHVVFEEAALVASDKRLTGRALLMRRLAIGTVAAIGATVLIGWIGAYLQGVSAIAHAEAEIDRFAAMSKDIPVRDVADADFLRVLQPLDALANATAEFRRRPLLGISFGLSQEQKVAAIHRRAYGRALNALLLPRLMVYLQKKLSDGHAGVDETFDALKLYGMLGGLGPMEPDSAVASSRMIFDALYPGEGRHVVRDSLTAHVAALVKQPLAPMETNDYLVATARKRIENQKEQERAFHVLNSLPQATALPVWSVSSVVSSSREDAFESRSGKDLRKGVPGLYTRNGFFTVVVPGLSGIANSVAKEGWVRGRGQNESMPPTDIARETLRLYFFKFEESWREYLSDVTVRRSESLKEMAETARLLASPPQPLVQLANSVAETTDLVDALNSRRFASAVALLPIDPGLAPDPYAALRDALKSTGNEKAKGDKSEAGSKVDAIQPLIKTLYDQLLRASMSSVEIAAIFDVKGALVAANQALVNEAHRLPTPLDQWVAGLSARVETVAVSAARSKLQPLWEAEGGRVCAAAIAGRYPFDRNAEREVAVDDFVRVFGPKGVFESFFADKLEPFVDTSADPWRWKGAFGTAGPASDTLVQFGRAHQIRQAFFSRGDQPSVSVTIKPETLDDSATAVILEVQGERVVYFHSRILPKTILWPARERSNVSQLIFQPGGWDQALSYSGTWSPMRLFDTADKTRLSADRFRAVFNHNGHSAGFEVQVGSILNPFTTDVLSAFRCPDKL